MALTTEQMNRIIVDEMVGRTQRESGPEAEKFLEQFKKERKEIEARGLRVQIPNE
jgi:hypothetical protein